MQLKPCQLSFAILCFILLTTTATPLLAAEKSSPEGTLALVNGVAITKAQLDMELRRIENRPR